MSDYRRRLWAFSTSDGDDDTGALVGSVADDGVATLRVYGPVDEWGGPSSVSAADVAAALDALPDGVTEIRLRINSPGGDVFEAVAIANLLLSYPARVVAMVDGVAASAASVLAVSADETIMGEGATLMVHDAWGLCVGNAAEMVTMSGLLDKMSGQIAGWYDRKAGGGVERWRAAMAVESWFTAEEAVDAGLADSVGSPVMPARVFDTSMYRFENRAAAPAPKLVATGPAPVAGTGGGDPPAVVGVTEGGDVWLRPHLTHLMV